MFCRNCGSAIEDGARFCGECGEPVVKVPDAADFDSGKTVEPGQNPIGTWPAAVSDTDSDKTDKVELRWDEQPVVSQPENHQYNDGTSGQQTWHQNTGNADDHRGTQPQGDGSVNSTYLLILRIFAGVMTAVFAIYTIRYAFGGVFGALSSLAGLITMLAAGNGYGYGYGSATYSIYMVEAVITNLITVLMAIGALLMLITMISVLAGWSEEKANEFPLPTIPAGIIMIGSVILRGIVTLIFAAFTYQTAYGFAGLLPLLLFTIIAIGGLFGLTMLMGFNPMAQITSGADILPVMKIAVFDTVKGFTEIMQRIGKNKNKAGAGAQYQNFGANGYQYVQTEPVRHLNTERGLAKYIVLSVITCGIYGLFMLHGIAKDLNTAFEGDGEETPGIWIYILLTILTCGVYAILWMYWTGNRIAKSGALMYGLHFEENGTTLLIWDLFSYSTCGVGGFLMWYYLLKNTNTVCRAYNEKNRV